MEDRDKAVKKAGWYVTKIKVSDELVGPFKSEKLAEQEYYRIVTRKFPNQLYDCPDMFIEMKDKVVKYIKEQYC